MTDAGWTATKPTEAGWYWWRWSKKDDPEVLWLSLIAGKLRVFTMSNENCEEYVDDYDGEWLGPITSTDRQHGRVEAYMNVLKECEQEASQAFRSGDYQLACRYIAEHCREQLAQQAQEGGVGDGG